MKSLPTNRAFQLTPDHIGSYLYMMDYRDIIEGVIEEVQVVEEDGGVSYVNLTVDGVWYSIMQNYSIRLEEGKPV